MDQRTVAAGFACVCSLCQNQAGDADHAAVFSAVSNFSWLRIDALPSGVTLGVNPVLSCAANVSAVHSPESITGRISASGAFK